MRFPRSVRLLSAADYSRVFKAPKKSSDAFFTVLARPANGDFARLGLAISKRNARRAVDRNRLKRLIREYFRLHQNELKVFDLVVMAKPPALKQSNERLRNSLSRLCEPIKR